MDVRACISSFRSNSEIIFYFGLNWTKSYIGTIDFNVSV